MTTQSFTESELAWSPRLPMGRGTAEDEPRRPRFLRSKAKKDQLATMNPTPYKILVKVVAGGQPPRTSLAPDSRDGPEEADTAATATTIAPEPGAAAEAAATAATIAAELRHEGPASEEAGFAEVHAEGRILEGHSLPEAHAEDGVDEVANVPGWQLRAPFVEDGIVASGQ